jgi:cytochrome d ubiquinol oxidase subunit I
MHAELLVADALLPSRVQMAFTLGYHVILVPLGVALPAYLVLMEGIGVFRRDPVALKVARRWSVVMAVTFAIGAVTGTILSFEFGLLWPVLMGRLGAAFGLGFAIEGIAFFLEAIFIGIYLYGWTRLPARIHFAFGLTLPPVGVLGTVSVLMANSWMNTPGGMTLNASGQVTGVDVLAALFTRSLGYEFWHFLIALYIAAGFGVASIYAVAWLRGRRDHYQRLAFAVPFTVAALLAPVEIIVGDLSARALVNDQPSKFAAMEVTWRTRSHNPEIIGGLLNGSGQVQWGLSLPSVDSILVGFSPDAVVPGLTSVAADARPTIVEANVTHLAFDVMVGLGSAGAALAAWYFLVLLFRRDLPQSRWFYRASALAGVGAYAGVESGWATTEVGRQPWIAYGTMRVSEAVTSAPAGFVWSMLSVLVLAYAAIATLFVILARRLTMRWQRADEAEAALPPAAPPEQGMPYGPRPESFSEPAPRRVLSRGDISGALRVIGLGALVALLASFGFLSAIVFSVFGLRAVTRRSLHPLHKG